MSTITFDTLKFAERLEKAGLTREVASALAEAQRESLSEALDTTLATKSDIDGLKRDIDRLEAKRDKESSLIKWMMGALIALAAANFAKQFF